MQIKRIGLQDLEDYVKIRYELWPNHSLEELKLEAQENLQDVEKNPGFFALDEEGNILGFIECSIHDSAPGCHTKKIGFVEGWYVKVEAQGKGIGRALMEAAEDWARSHACTEMASDTTKDYPKSPAAHKALGFLESSVPMHYYKKLKKTW
jgi:aminoglycoside 6'-N-acetyltransferase I